MSLYSKQTIVEYSADQMFDLVNDVKAYPSFIPLVASVKILDQKDQHMRVAFKIAKGLLGFEFTTLNSFEMGRLISMSLEEGPFKRFKGYWRFTPLAADTCSIYLNLEFEFSSALFRMILDTLFNQLCASMIDAFRKRAAILYGK